MGRWWVAVSAWLRWGSRSNGVRVRRVTLAHIRVADAARSRREWPLAARGYCAALSREPGLVHLWIQLGHMEKEAGRSAEAATAYAEAARLRPDDVEPLLHLGHMAKIWAGPVDAARHFVAALHRDAGNMEATGELVRLLPDRDEVDPALWFAILDVLDIDPDEQAATEVSLPPGATLFDVTDLIAFFGQRRLPTGIQRVQIEVSLALLDGDMDVRPVFCIYASARRGWVGLPEDLFHAICRLARQGDDTNDPVWKSRLDRLYRRIAIGRTIRFHADAALVNLGASWSDRNYLLDVRLLRARDGVAYIPFVHDLIPLIGPEWCMDALARDYRAWFESLLHSADAYLSNSQATRDDLLRVAADRGVSMPASAVAVVRLDGDFRQPAAPVSALAARGLAPLGYVLLVSTLEPRKNHVGAFRAWLALADALGEAAVPRLVCVGGRGWLNDALHAMLRERPALRRMVLILHGVPDEELAALYEHCLFVLYPSFYEGWGLPVSEALSWGKVPATSRTSSMPEAGGAFARYFDPADVQDIAVTVRALLDEGMRTAAEAAIRADYRPRAWRQIAQDILDRRATAASRGDAILPCLDGAGAWTLALADRRPDDGDTAPEVPQGEALRHGRAWQTIGPEGCRIRGDDAELRFRWTGTAGAMLQIMFAPPVHAAEVRVTINGRCRSLALEPGEATIFSHPLSAVSAIVRVAILPLTCDGGGDEPGDVIVASVGVVRSRATP